MAICLSTLGIPATPPEVAALALKCGARISGGTDLNKLLSYITSVYGIIWNTTDNINTVKEHVISGGVAIANVAGNGMFSSTGHYITILLIKNEKAVIGDPGWYAGKYSSRKYPKRKAVTDIGNGLVISDLKTVDDDCNGRNPRYYLIKVR